MQISSHSKRENLSGTPMPDRQRGSAMVEFAIVSPIAILLVMAIIQFGLTFSAKEILNEAAFVAARAGSLKHANRGVMLSVMTKGLIPFYQDTTNKNDPYGRLSDALAKATADAGCNPGACMLDLQVMNPLPTAFDDFAMTNAVSPTQRFIPNDNLGYRSRSAGGASGISIQDANILRIRVTYGYPIRVPFMQGVIQTAMCSVEASPDCGQYYSQGRMPIVVYATVHMQTPAFPPDDPL